MYFLPNLVTFTPTSLQPNLRLLSMQSSLLISTTAILSSLLHSFSSSSHPKLRCSSPRLFQQIYLYNSNLLQQLLNKSLIRFKIFLTAYKTAPILPNYKILLSSSRQSTFLAHPLLLFFAHGGLQPSQLSLLNFGMSVCPSSFPVSSFKRSLKTPQFLLVSTSCQLIILLFSLLFVKIKTSALRAPLGLI